MDPAWSLDSKKLLYVSAAGMRYSTDQDFSEPHIMSISLDGTRGPALLGGDNSSQRYPSYSPDGNWITFSSDKSGNWDIYVARADGSHSTDITNSPSDEIQPSWGK